MDGLKQMKLHRCVNIILVGDHGTVRTRTHTRTHTRGQSHRLILTFPSEGMEEAQCERTEFLSNYMNVDDIILVPGAMGRIRSRYPNNLKCERAIVLKGRRTNMLLQHASTNGGGPASMLT